MEYRSIIAMRHSVRDFRPEPVAREKLEALVDAAGLAPSSGNEQPWRFYVTTGESRRHVGEIISQTTIHLAEFLDVMGEKGVANAAQWYSMLGNAPVLVAVASPTSDDPLTRMTRQLSVGAAIENFLLAAVDEGLGACNITYSHWVQDELAEALELPDGWAVLSVIAVGYPGAKPPFAPPHRPSDAVWLD